jgi:hypothetical protein
MGQNKAAKPKILSHVSQRNISSRKSMGTVMVIATPSHGLGKTRQYKRNTNRKPTYTKIYLCVAIVSGIERNYPYPVNLEHNFERSGKFY